ncbi:response regulator transcription factor [Tenacibaculum maritimum]|uniref:response regulator transcription factor n=1 Tax=Tenacibaculum maritimum TaxID=107401 RepID=UPI0012E6A6CA|nr:response regulator transcription factor [Tenacibaculum maritimum]CAA0254962.1 putative Response regulator UvrY [Tenacibaculum maritimum]
MNEIKVVIAEDNDIVSEAYKANLEADGISVVGVVKNGLELIEWVEANTVDVIILDVEMPIMDGIDTAKYFVKNNMNYKILVVSGHHTNSFIEACKNTLNVSGFITKTYCHLELTEGVIEVFEGGKYFSQMPVLENAETLFIKQKMLRFNLADEEKEILNLLPEYTYNEMAKKKGVSYWTIKNTFLRIREKLGINSNIELAKLMVYNNKNKK